MSGVEGLVFAHSLPLLTGAQRAAPLRDWLASLALLEAGADFDVFGEAG